MVRRSKHFEQPGVHNYQLRKERRALSKTYMENIFCPPSPSGPSLSLSVHLLKISNLLSSQRCPWTPSLWPTPVSQGLGLQECVTMTCLGSAGDWTQCFIHVSRGALHWMTSLVLKCFLSCSLRLRVSSSVEMLKQEAGWFYRIKNTVNCLLTASGHNRNKNDIASDDTMH